jgi:hypothetical protein
VDLRETLDEGSQHLIRSLSHGVEINFHTGARVGTLKVRPKLVTELTPRVYGLTREVHEPRQGRASQGHGEIVHHHHLFFTSHEDGGNVDLEELSEVDRHVVLLW